MPSPVDQQLALELGYGLVELPGGLVRVGGPDRMSWLTTLGSQVIREHSENSGQEALFLSPQGKIRFACGVVDDGNSTWLYTGQDDAKELAEFLNSMRFTLRVEVEDCSSRVQLFGFCVTGASKAFLDTVESIYPVWFDPWAEVQPGGTSYTDKGFEHPGLNIRFAVLAVAREAAATFCADAIKYWEQQPVWPIETEDGYKLEKPYSVTYSVWQTVQIKALRPTIRDVDARALPHELDWLRTAVHLHKGCYCGQETVARVVNLGRPPRVLALAQIDGSTNDLPLRFADIRWKGRTIGSLLKAGRDFELGTIGLALIKKNVPIDEQGFSVVWDDESEVERSLPISLERVVSETGKCWDSPEQRPGEELRRRNLPTPEGRASLR